MSLEIQGSIKWINYASYPVIAILYHILGYYELTGLILIHGRAKSVNLLAIAIRIIFPCRDRNDLALGCEADIIQNNLITTDIDHQAHDIFPVFVTLILILLGKTIHIHWKLVKIPCLPKVLKYLGIRCINTGCSVYLNLVLIIDQGAVFTCHRYLDLRQHLVIQTI